MSELKFRNIKNIEDDKCVGLLQGASNDSNLKVNQNISSLNQFIIDFNAFIEDDLKLTRIADPLQIDPTHITYTTDPSVLVNYSNSTAPVSAAENNKEFIMGYNVFAFNDALQDTHPLTFKFEYVFRNIEFHNNYAAYPRLTLIIKLSIIDGVTGTEYVSKSTLGTYGSGSHSNTVTFYYINQQQVDSFGFNTNGRIFMNVLPRRSISCAVTDSAFRIPPGAYFSFYFERNDKFMKYINFTYNLYGSSNVTATFFVYNNMTSSMSYISKGNTLKNSNQFCYIPYLKDSMKSSNSEFATFGTTDFDPTTGYFYKNNNILVTYSDLINKAIISQVIDIKLPNGEIGKYLVYNNTQNFRFYNNNASSLLFRMDK